MSQFFIDSNSIPGGSINTLSAEGGAATPPNGNNFNFSGTVAGGYGMDGAIVFSTVNPGEMNAQVQVDGTTVTINASNQLQVLGETTGTATTIGATTATIITIPMTDATVVTLDGILSGYEPTLPAGIGSNIIATFIRSGGGATLIQIPDDQVNASATLTAATYSVSGSGNNIIITVTGQAGVTINWRCSVRTVTAP